MADETLPPCPTPCDDDCELNPDGCHESHQVQWKRSHQPHGCHEVREAIAAAAAEPRARAAFLERKLAEILATFYDRGHPGGPALRSCWVDESVVAGWRRLIRAAPDREAS